MQELIQGAMTDPARNEPAHPVEPLEPERRDALHSALDQLCRLGAVNPAARAGLEQALTPLAKAAEARVRAVMAETLADAGWAPAAAVRWLAFDRLEVAQPILERSLMLTEADLLALADSDLARRLVIAGRISVSETLSAALAQRREPEVIRRLAHNPGALISAESAADFMAVARADQSLQAALAGREQLPRAFARALFVFAAFNVRSALLTRFPDLPHDKLNEAIQQAEETASAPGQPAARLAERLDEAGRLNAAYVLRALCEGRHEVFDECLAQMTAVPSPDWRRALATSSVRAWVLAARALDLDPSAVPAAYADLVRAGRAHALSADALTDAIEELYGRHDGAQARAALRRLAAPGSMS